MPIECGPEKYRPTLFRETGGRNDDRGYTVPQGILDTVCRAVSRRRRPRRLGQGPVGSTGLNVSLAVYHWGAGLWLRGGRGESLTESASRTQAYKDAFWGILNETFNGRFPDGPGTEWANLDGGFDARREFDVSDQEIWPEMASWLHYMLEIYLRVIERTSVPQV